MKFIGHLDTMRYFQKAIRRAGLDAAYSEGFHPHMLMSFASPLGIGITSDAEYLDLELTSAPSSEEAVSALNDAGVEGIRVTDFIRIPEDKANKAMTLVAAADYTLSLRSGHEPGEGWQSSLRDFLNRDSIVVLKKSKHREAKEDIRPLIYEATVGESSLFLRLAAGSKKNLKPELIIEAWLEDCGRAADPFLFEINRDELYADLGADERKLVKLGDLGEKL